MKIAIIDESHQQGGQKMLAHLSLITMLFGTLLVVLSIIVGPTDPERASLFYPIGLLAAAVGFGGLLVINQKEPRPSDKNKNPDRSS